MPGSMEIAEINGKLGGGAQQRFANINKFLQENMPMLKYDKITKTNGNTGKIRTAGNVIGIAYSGDFSSLDLNAFAISICPNCDEWEQEKVVFNLRLGEVLRIPYNKFAYRVEAVAAYLGSYNFTITLINGFDFTDNLDIPEGIAKSLVLATIAAFPDNTPIVYSTNTNITVTNANTALLATNGNRKKAVIYNNGGVPIALGFGANAVFASGMIVQPGYYWEEEGLYINKQAINAITAAVNCEVRVLEGV